MSTSQEKKPMKTGEEKEEQRRSKEDKKTKARGSKRKTPTIEDGKPNQKLNEKRRINFNPTVSMPKKELQDRIKAKEASSSEGPMNPMEPKSEAAAEEGGVNERNGPQHQKRKGGHGQEAKAKVPRCSPSLALSRQR